MRRLQGSRAAVIVRDAISPRQYEVLGFIARGYTSEAIGHALHISPQTVRTHVQMIMTRLGVRTRAQATAMWAAEEAERLCWQQLAPWERDTYYRRRQVRQRRADLEAVVRDQRQHIANLEDQLLGVQGPHEGGEQDSLL
jgi:DNA-binding CsgD family transcriptional regulator